MRITKNSQQKPNTHVQNLANQLQGMSQIIKNNTVYIGFTQKQIRELEKKNITRYE